MAIVDRRVARDAYMPKIKVEPGRLRWYEEAYARRLKRQPDLSFADWARSALDAQATRDLSRPPMIVNEPDPDFGEGKTAFLQKVKIQSLRRARYESAVRARGAGWTLSEWVRLALDVQAHSELRG